MDVTIRFRATGEEKQILEAGAKRAGLSLSEWMRGVLLSASGDVGHVEGSPEPEAVQDVVKQQLSRSEQRREKFLSPEVQACIPPRRPKQQAAPLTREEREAKIAAAQSWLVKGKK